VGVPPACFFCFFCFFVVGKKQHQKKKAKKEEERGQEALGTRGQDVRDTQGRDAFATKERLFTGLSANREDTMGHKQHHHSQGPGANPSDAQKPPEQAAPGAPGQPAPEQAAPAAAAHPPAPADELTALRAEKDDLLKRLQRVSADFLNYQKRIQKEIQHSREFANEGLIKAMLPVLDDVERALESGAAKHAENDPLIKGLRLVKDKALAALGQFGLTVIECQGKPFDPDHHQAVTQQPSADVPPHTVLKELCKGYALQGRTIRPAMVIVSSDGREQDAEKPEPEEEC
jgi:molecular chaperone GrpE